MRIVGGEFKGRIINAPDSDLTRPITDKAREALFNMLGDVSDLRVLDAYAGSGSLSLETISRGAKSAVAIDSSKEAITSITNNIQNLSVAGRVEVVHQDVTDWLENNIGGNSFDIVFADPPFDKFNEENIKELATHSKRVLVLKHSRRIEPIELDNMELVRSRRYGESVISIYLCQ
ncbi:MAG: 16S rRNA (guanine(966)-N(2))-methyltransferase RsmD [Candidatus Saccharimonadales bacterium]